MSLRESLRRHARGVSIGLILLMVGVAGIVASSLSGGGVTGSKNAKAFYSCDDGTTWFADAINQIPPFDHDGKQAVRAYVFKTSGGKQFVGFLQRYTEAAKKTVATPALGPVPASGIEVKKPGPGNKWVVQATKAGSEAAKVVAPDGTSTVEPVSP